MNRNVLYSVIALLAIGLGVTIYLYYQTSQSGLSIEIGEKGVKIQGN